MLSFSLYLFIENILPVNLLRTSSKLQLEQNRSRRNLGSKFHRALFDRQKLPNKRVIYFLGRDLARPLARTLFCITINRRYFIEWQMAHYTRPWKAFFARTCEPEKVCVNMCVCVCWRVKSLIYLYIYRIIKKKLN